MLRAFGQSEPYTLRERTNRILDLHEQFSCLVGHFNWKVLNKKTVEIDVREKQTAYPVVLQKVKQGLNAKVVNPIRYKEDDTADVPSSCTFLSNEYKDYRLTYPLGYPSHYGYPGLSICIDNMHDEQLFNKERVEQIAKLFVTSWKPEMLCVTDREYFHNISKASENRVPWTGWCTYISNGLLERAHSQRGLLKNFFSPGLNHTIDRLADFETETIEGLGKLIWTGVEPFTQVNKEQVNKAIKLELYFIENKIRLSV